jgi:Rrf2 family transcriptional regulator, iron-sulfur cluster assembly transcription factor
MLSKKSVNAINAMVWLGILQATGPVSLQKISDAMGVSISCLEQVFSALKSNGLIDSYKGPGGGYVTRSPLSNISLWSVAKPFEQEATITERASWVSKDHPEKLSPELIFEQFQHASEMLLNDVSLQEAVDMAQTHSTSEVFKPVLQTNRFKLKPLPNSNNAPRGPNSVFSWAQMM